MNTDELTTTITHVAETCGVQPNHVEIAFYVYKTDARAEVPWWTVRVNVKCRRVVHKCFQLSGGGETLQEAADNAIVIVRHRAAEGLYWTERGVVFDTGGIEAAKQAAEREKLIEMLVEMAECDRATATERVDQHLASKARAS